MCHAGKIVYLVCRAFEVYFGDKQGTRFEKHGDILVTSIQLASHLWSFEENFGKSKHTVPTLASF